GVWHEIHATAVRLRVRDGHAVSPHRVAFSVDAYVEGLWLPGNQRAKPRVQVHELAADQLRLVGDAVGVGVEAAARDARVRRAGRLLAGVLGARRLDHAEIGAETLQLRAYLGEGAGGTPGACGRVDHHR